MANNIWSNYTEKTATPVDADEVMVRDSTDGKNKRLLFGTFWKWVAKKLNEATISELQTSNKTIIGAINALNSEVVRTTNTSDFSTAYEESNFRILYGLIENVAYISFDIIWIRIQLRCSLNNIEMRCIYGSSPAPEWKSIYTK